MININKGSQWCLWDLHFHSPSSYDYGDKSVSNERIIDVLRENGMSVVAITDHHFIDVERIRELQRLGLPHGITILPGIEFLSDARGKEPVHFIGLFSEKADIEFIWPQIQNRTEISKIRGDGKRENEVYCDLFETAKIIKELGGLISIHAGEKSGSVENITHALPHAAAQKRDIAEIVDIYEIGKVSDQDGYQRFVFPNIGRTIPMVLCSDNHNINKYHRKSKLWIKGAPNFSGLLHALNEPDERFFIGDEPAAISRVRTNPTKYIRSLKIFNSGDHDPEHVWFHNVEIPLNSELVTIIGNKGSGKSALSDILALCTDAENGDDYLFLHKTKFKKKGLADRFSAAVQFETGSWTDFRQLDCSVLVGEQAKIRYLPQSYFEKVCNEIGKVEAFRNEIEKVVFQYVPVDKRLGKANFAELVRHKQSSIVEKISVLTRELAEINNRIINLEDKSHPDFKKSLNGKLKLKEAELLAHLASKPPEKKDPGAMSNDPSVAARKLELDNWIKRREQIEIEMAEVDAKIVETSIKLDSLEKFRDEIFSSITQLLQFIELKREQAKNLGFEIDQLVSLKYDFSNVDAAIQQKAQEKGVLVKQNLVDLYSGDLEYDKLATLALKQIRCNREVAKLQGQFSGEQKEYQSYLEDVRNWENQKRQIEGDALTADSLLFFRQELSYVEEKLPIELAHLRSTRLQLSKEIFAKKTEVRSFYDDIKIEIDKCFNEVEVPGLAIASTLASESDLAENLLKFIQQNKSGSFYGPDGRTILLVEIIAPTDWNDVESVSSMLDKVIHYLEHDMREAAKESSRTYISNLVKQRAEFYNFLFSLGYVQPHYELQQGGKSLEQLSPGEKGALLLIFYLLLDKEDIPLVIDQPEDNLDNYSVAKILVPFIKKAKRKRQIVIVTHNPNLAVVADSEQIIKVNLEKDKGNQFNCMAGGIEDDYINSALVEVLEGTMPAFSTRRDKYHASTA